MNKTVKNASFWFVVTGLASASLPIIVKSPYHIHILTSILVNILIASGLQLIMTTGLVSFAHAAFVAIGGYASALAVMKLGWSSWAGLFLSIFAAVVISSLFGMILLRLRGTYFLIATTAFGEIVLLTFIKWKNPFGGAAGLSSVPPPSPINLFGLGRIMFDSKVDFYYLALFLVFASLVVIYRLEKGRIGELWSGIRQAEELCQSVGVNVMAYKVFAFVSCASPWALTSWPTKSSHLPLDRPRRPSPELIRFTIRPI